SVISPNSLTADNGRVGDTKLIYMIGKSPGFTLRKLGGGVIFTGSLRGATVSAGFTSSAGAAVAGWGWDWVGVEGLPRDDAEVSEVMPAMVESWRSIGAATDAAMVSALAPGSCPWMLMVGKSTAGSAATASSR